MIADLRPALRTFLLADAAIAAAVGGNRVYPAVLPQGEQRASVVYNLIAEVTDHHMQGPSGLVMQRVQVDSWAAEPDAADDLARLVKARLDGFRGTMGDGADTVEIQGVFSETARTRHSAEPELFGTGRDYLIHFAER